MKKYKRMLPLVSPGKVGLVGACLALAAGVVYLVWGSESPGVVILGGFGAAVLFCGLMAALPGGIHTLMIGTGSECFPWGWNTAGRGMRTMRRFWCPTRLTTTGRGMAFIRIYGRSM